jgi:hypothetical protein
VFWGFFFCLLGLAFASVIGLSINHDDLSPQLTRISEGLLYHRTSWLEARHTFNLYLQAPFPHSELLKSPYPFSFQEISFIIIIQRAIYLFTRIQYSVDAEYIIFKLKNTVRYKNEKRT